MNGNGERPSGVINHGCLQGTNDQSSFKSLIE